MIPDLFSPQKLLKKNMTEYVSYVEQATKIILIIFAIFIILTPLIMMGLNIDEIFNKTLLIYRVGFSAGIVLTLTMLFIQSCITRKHKQASIDLEKAVKAVDLLYQWSKDSNAEMLLARKIVDRMNTTEVKKLVDGIEMVSIGKNDYEMLKGFLPKDKIDKPTTEKKEKEDIDNIDKNKCEFIDNCCVANSIQLSMFETLWLRSWVVKYLNIMEVIMYAWKADIVDRNVIEKEFGYLVKSERDGSVVLAKYRELSGQENYPGIYSFCNEMDQRNKKEIEKIKVQG